MTVSPTPSTFSSVLNAGNIELARATVPVAFLDSPQFVSVRLSQRAGVPVVVKMETVNPIGCFKGRGTWEAIRALRARGSGKEVVVASSGNFGLGIAYAGREQGLAVTVFVPTTANATKLDRIRSLGANLQLVGTDVEATIAASEDYATRSGHALLVDGVEPWIAVGAGTIGEELTRGMAAASIPWLGAVYVPVGAGALISGIGTWIRHASPSTRVVGAQAANAPSASLSWKAGTPVATATADSRADGIAGKTTLPEALAMFRPVVDDFALVSESTILAEQDYLTRELGVTVEAASATGWAAILAAKPTEPVAFIVTGSNVPPRP